MQQRYLGFYEGYCHLLYRLYRGTGIVVTTATVAGELSPETVRAVILALQLRHPLLRASIVETPGGNDRFDTAMFDGADEATRRTWLPLTVQARASAGWQEVAEAAAEEPLGRYHWRVVMLAGRDRHDLILLSGHAISDALSTTHFLRDLVFGCGRLLSGETLNWAPLPMLPAVEDQVPRPAPVPFEMPAVEARGRWPYYGYAELEQRKGLLLFRQFDADFCTALKQRCKQEGVTVNSALGTALMLAQWSATVSAPVALPYLFMSAINLRHVCNPPIADEHYGSYVACVNTWHDLATEPDFWCLARDYGKALVDHIAIAARNGYLPQNYVRDEIVQLIADDLDRGREQHCFPESPVLSNLGVLKFAESYGPLRLVDMYFGTRQMSGDCGVSLSVLTLHGRISCCYAAPVPLASRAQLSALADEVARRLRDAC